MLKIHPPFLKFIKAFLEAGLVIPTALTAYSIMSHRSLAIKLLMKERSVSGIEKLHTFVVTFSCVLLK